MFIHLEDFNYNADKLGDYLKYLDKNETAYLEYFSYQHDQSDIEILKRNFRVDNVGICQIVKQLEAGTLTAKNRHVIDRLIEQYKNCTYQV